MPVPSVNVVFRCIITEQTQVQKVSSARQEFERRKIAFVERTGVGPNPANAVLFQQPDDLGPVPAGVTKFNRKPEAFRKLDKKFSQNLSAILGRERGRQLNQHNLEL